MEQQYPHKLYGKLKHDINNTHINNLNKSFLPYFLIANENSVEYADFIENLSNIQFISTEIKVLSFE